MSCLNGLFYVGCRSTFELFDAPVSGAELAAAYQWLSTFKGTFRVHSFHDDVFDALFPRLQNVSHLIIGRHASRRNVRKLLGSKFEWLTRLTIEGDYDVNRLGSFLEHNAVLTLTCKYEHLLFDALTKTHVKGLVLTSRVLDQIVTCPRLESLRVSISTRFECTQTFGVLANACRNLTIEGDFGSKPVRVKTSWVKAICNYSRWTPEFMRSLEVDFLEVSPRPNQIIDWSDLVRVNTVHFTRSVSMVVPPAPMIILDAWDKSVVMHGQLRSVDIDCPFESVEAALAVPCRTLRVGRFRCTPKQLNAALANPYLDKPADVNTDDRSFISKSWARIAVRVFSEVPLTDGDHAIRSRVLGFLC